MALYIKYLTNYNLQIFRRILKSFTLISLEKVIHDYRKLSKRRYYFQCLLIGKVRKYFTGFHLSDCYISSSF